MILDPHGARRLLTTGVNVSMVTTSFPVITEVVFNAQHVIYFRFSTASYHSMIGMLDINPLGSDCAV